MEHCNKERYNASLLHLIGKRFSRIQVVTCASAGFRKNMVNNVYFPSVTRSTQKGQTEILFDRNGNQNCSVQADLPSYSSFDFHCGK